MSACDLSYLVPHVNDPKYIQTLLKIAKENDVNMIVPLFDIDLHFLSKAKQLFKRVGVDVIISSENVIQIANDKLETFNFLKKHGFKSPKTYIDLKKVSDLVSCGQLSFPLVVKPRFGMGSIGVFIAENLEELMFFYKYVHKQIDKSYLKKLSSTCDDEIVLIQEHISGKEFGVDIFNDLSGEYIINVNKEKILMSYGETDISVVIKNKDLDKVSVELSSKLKHVGNLDIDVLYDGTDYYVLELNARFGGGFPFSYLAGADFSKVLVDLVLGRKVIKPTIKTGIICMKKIEPIVYKDKI